MIPECLQSEAFADLSEGCAVRVVERDAARNLGPEDPVLCREVLVAYPELLVDGRRDVAEDALTLREWALGTRLAPVQCTFSRCEQRDSEVPT